MHYHGRAENEHKSKLQHQANLEFILQFGFFPGTPKKATSEFACNRLVKDLCKFCYHEYLLVFV